MARISRETTWFLIAAGSAMIAGVAAHKALEASWRRVKKKEPPKQPELAEKGWPEALAWTAAVSLLVGFVRLFARRGAALGWKRLTGAPPPKP